MVAEKEKERKKEEKIGRNNLLGNYVVTPTNAKWAGNVFSIWVGFMYKNMLPKYKNLRLFSYIQKNKYSNLYVEILSLSMREEKS